MKRLLFLLMALPIVFIGCKKNDVQNSEPEAVQLTVLPEVINCPGAGGDYMLSITASEAWSAKCSDSWLTVSPTSGNAGTSEVRVSVYSNKTDEPSSSKIVFRSGDQASVVSIKRAAKEPARLAVVSETDIQTPQDGGSFIVKVESNIKWQVSSNVSWATVSGEAVKRNNDNVTINVTAATQPQETSATITVSPYGGEQGVEKQVITITRSGTDATSMTVSQSEIKASEDGGSFTVNVTTTAKWRATTSWELDWITLSNAEATGSGALGIQVAPARSTNEASGIITIKEVRTDNYPPVSLNVLVTRKGKAASSLTVSPLSINVPVEGGEYPIEIKSNYPWTANFLFSSNDFSLSTTSGDGDAVVVLNVKPSYDEKERTAAILVKSSFGGEEQRINIRCESQYVDFGLPSGTLWKRVPEECGEVTYEEASSYGPHIPSYEQWEELTKKCDWTKTSNGYKIKRNDKSFILPFGTYWTSKYEYPGHACMYAVESEKKYSFAISTGTCSVLIVREGKK